MKLATHFAITSSHVTETDCAYIIPVSLRTEFHEANMLFCDLATKGTSDTEYTLIAIHELEVSVVKQINGLIEV